MFFTLFHFFWCGMTEIPARWILTAPKGCAGQNRNSTIHESSLYIATAYSDKPAAGINGTRAHDLSTSNILWLWWNRHIYFLPKALTSSLSSLFHIGRSMRVEGLVIHLVLKQPSPFISHAVHIKIYDILYSKADLNALLWGFPKVLWHIFPVSLSLSTLFFTTFFHFHVYVLSTAKLSISQPAGWVGFLIEKNQSKKRHL